MEKPTCANSARRLERQRRMTTARTPLHARCDRRAAQGRKLKPANLVQIKLLAQNLACLPRPVPARLRPGSCRLQAVAAVGLRVRWARCARASPSCSLSADSSPVSTYVDDFWMRKDL